MLENVEECKLCKGRWLANPAEIMVGLMDSRKKIRLVDTMEDQWWNEIKYVIQI